MVICWIKRFINQTVNCAVLQFWFYLKFVFNFTAKLKTNFTADSSSLCRSFCLTNQKTRAGENFALLLTNLPAHVKAKVTLWISNAVQHIKLDNKVTMVQRWVQIHNDSIMQHHSASNNRSLFMPSKVLCAWFLLQVKGEIPYLAQFSRWKNSICCHDCTPICLLTFSGHSCITVRLKGTHMAPCFASSINISGKNTVGSLNPNSWICWQIYFLASLDFYQFYLLIVWP